MKNVISLLFNFWMLLSLIGFVTDIISYYNIMSEVDWFQLVNRDMNVEFIHWFCFLPFIIVTFYSFSLHNKKIKKTEEDEFNIRY